jgi:fucose permease
MSTALAGAGVSLYWGGLTLGRLASGAVVHRVRPVALLRASLLLVPALLGLLWAGLSPLSDLVALSALGFVCGPVFPLLIAGTSARVGEAHAANAVGIQISFASFGWAVLPGAAGVIAQAQGLGAIPPFLLACALLVILLHEALVARSRPAASP